jgi:predicted ATPase
MITELRLENWKSFGEATLYIDPLSILIGTNASGKSNVLDALQFLQRIASGANVKDALSSLRGGLDWVVKKPNNIFSLSVTNQILDDKYQYTIRCNIKENQDVIIVDECLAVLNHKKEFRYHTDYQGISSLYVQFFSKKINTEGESGIPIWCGSVAMNIGVSVRRIAIFNPIASTMTNYSTLSDQIDSDAGNIAGVLAALSSRKQKEIEDTLTQYASRLPERDIHRVYAEKVGKLGKDAMLYCDEKWGESGEVFTVDARAMSDGTLRFLAILTALLTLPEGSLLAIDEVDNGFHPSRAHLLLEALQTIGKQRNIDVLVTTHNPALLDALGTEFVPFVTVAHRDSITGESKLTLLEDIEQLPKLLAQGTVGKLSTQGLIEKSLESVHG